MLVVWPPGWMSIISFVALFMLYSSIHHNYVAWRWWDGDSEYCCIFHDIRVCRHDRDRCRGSPGGQTDQGERGGRGRKGQGEKREVKTSCTRFQHFKWELNDKDSSIEYFQYCIFVEGPEAAAATKAEAGRAGRQGGRGGGRRHRGGVYHVRQQDEGQVPRQ